MAGTAITGLLQIGWATVGRTVARVTAEHLDERRLDGLVAIRVDESLPPTSTGAPQRAADLGSHQPSAEGGGASITLGTSAKFLSCHGRLRMHPFAPVGNARPVVGSVCRAGEAGPGWVVKVRERS
jgi:hypothetical protein